MIDAIELVKRFEGLHRVGKDGLVYPYLCPAGFPTIGYGRRVKDMSHPPISVNTAELWLLEDVGSAVSATIRLCPVLAFHENKLAAVADFVCNLGAGRLQSSTLRRRINQSDWNESVNELKRWVYGGGKILPGLVARREAEIELFQRG